jgi:hypothetical protein
MEIIFEEADISLISLDNNGMTNTMFGQVASRGFGFNSMIGNPNASKIGFKAIIDTIDTTEQSVANAPQQTIGSTTKGKLNIPSIPTPRK